MGNKKTSNKKKSNKKRSRPCDHAEEPPRGDTEILSQEEFMERIRRARAEWAGAECQPSPPQPKNKGSVKPFIPPFDPHLPPAAFPSLPTIGEPIPTGTREGHLRRVNEDRERRLQGLEPLPRESYHPGPIFRISGQDDATEVNEPVNNQVVRANASSPEHEAPGRANANLETRNTVLNPVHRSNTAVMVRGERKDLAEVNTLDLANRPDIDFSDSDIEIITEQESPVPDWNDLNQSLQAEIMDNLLEKDTWEQAVIKLGLTRKQERTTKESLIRFHEAMEHEEEESKKMRNKQHQAMLNRDHSNDHNVPDDHVLGQILNQHLKNVMTDMNQELRKSKTGELLAAWRFLDKRELPRELAGVWSNGFEEIQPAEDDEPRTKRVRWTDSLPTTEEHPPMPMETGPARQLSSGKKADFLNNIGRGSSIAPPALGQHPMETMEKYWDEWEQLFTQPYENRAHLAREGRLRLAFGAGGAADIMANQNGPALPEPAVAQYRYNQRIERARREAEAEKSAAAANPLPFTGRDIAEGIWEEKLEARYQKLANDCTKLFLSYDSRSDVEYEENSDLDEKALDALLEEASRFNREYRGLARAGSSSQPQDP